jgi:uncharacterized ferritin-like protein (DUF455 family)
MELYTTLEHIITAPSVVEKIGRFEAFYPLYCQGVVTLDPLAALRVFDHPSYATFCTVIDPKAVSRRPKLGGLAGQIALLHSVAHIEYSAIDLALDAAYRFRDVGKEFIEDWLKVAKDEIRHFRMIEHLLGECGSFYGHLPVHNGLFEASMQTLSFLERMAVVPRYLEANGLDATPLILAKLSTLPATPLIDKIVHALHIIVEEEVDHVLKGDKWFKVACERENLPTECYFTIIENHYPNSFPRKVPINCDARKRSGFDPKELQHISCIAC